MGQLGTYRFVAIAQIGVQVDHRRRTSLGLCPPQRQRHQPADGDQSEQRQQPGAAAHYATVTQIGAFVLKTVFFAWLFIWVRWTLPRFRYDQLMKLGWRIMLPLALLNFFVTAAVVLVVNS